MSCLGESRLIRTLLAACTLCLASPLPVLAQGAAPQPQAADTTQQHASAVDVDTALQQARELIKSGDYDRAIEILKPAIAPPRKRLSNLREAYLLLIKARVMAGNYLRSQPKGYQASILSHEEAKRLIAECLRIKELRHTRPEPESEYPREMLAYFAEVRGQIFGSFRVAKLEPEDATALLDADTLRVLSGQAALGDVDLAVGPHLLVIRRVGFKDLTDQISISPGAVLAQSYELQKKRGRWWYVSRGAAGLGVVGGVIVALASKGSKTGATNPEPLPGPPLPPDH